MKQLMDRKNLAAIWTSKARHSTLRLNSPDMIKPSYCDDNIADGQHFSQK